jgi:amidase
MDVVEASVPFPSEDWEPFMALWSVGALQAPVPGSAEHLLRPLTRWLRDLGRRTTGLEYAQALADAQRLTRRTAEAWSDLDLVLTPTLAALPAPVGALRDDADPAGDFAAQTRYTPWTSVANLTGRPSISLPVELTTQPGGVQVPVGVMLTGRWGGDATLLSVAAALEEVVRWADRVAPEPPPSALAGRGPADAAGSGPR